MSDPTTTTTPRPEGASTGGATESGTTGQAQQTAQEVAGQAHEQARQAAGQARDQLRTQVDQRSTEAGRRVAETAGDIRSVGEQLREQGKDRPAQYAEQAADRIERVGSYLQRSDADRILSDAEDFARQRPWAVVAGGIALGFAASRFLKAGQSGRSAGRTPSGPPADGRPELARAGEPQHGERVGAAERERWRTTGDLSTAHPQTMAEGSEVTLAGGVVGSSATSTDSPRFDRPAGGLGSGEA